MLCGILRGICATLFILIYNGSCNNEYCYLNSECGESKDSTRYLLYDVNPPEGFNLRRDVYMRVAVLAHNLQNSRNQLLHNFKLVLPPWSHLLHWKFSESPEHIPWSLYFDLSSLQKFAPVIEMYEFFQAVNENRFKIVLDEVYVLQHFEDMFKTGNFEDRMTIDECQKGHQNNEINYFHYSNITSNNVKCLSFHGPATKLKELLLSSTASTILLQHAEVALHEMFGNNIYWQARRSMRFSDNLRQIANDFREHFLNSTDESDNTFLPNDWRDEKPKRNSKGGPYVAMHLRRRDFLRGRPNVIPSLESVARQTAEALEKLHLKTVFVATDATDEEYKRIVKELSPRYAVVKYVPAEEVETYYKNGGVAIIDQIICSHARYFIGTHESTFSFRIQEEREILGFPVESTFNCFCREGAECKKPSVWKIVY